MNLSPSDPHLLAITEYYGDKRAARSGVRYIQHIHEGLIVLDRIGASKLAAQAYCLHPIFQSDDALKEWVARPAGSDVLKAFGFRLSTTAIVLAMEYRKAANSYLSFDQPSDYCATPLPEVQDMLIADKVQNRKDFERYHAVTHPRHAELKTYFFNWMTILMIEEATYKAHVAAILVRYPWPEVKA